MFIAHVTQAGEGCGYSISCGETLWKLKAETYEEALAELKNEVLGTFYPDDGLWDEGFWGESRLASITLFEVSKEEILPLSEWYSQARQTSEEAKQRLSEAAERRQYKELKEKFADDTAKEQA